MKLICYLSNGYPSIEASIRMAETYVQAGCDVMEVDFPGRNPYLEGDFIAGRMKQALAACDDYDRYMDGMAEIRRRLPHTTLLLMIYEDTLLEIGYDRFVAFCRTNGFSDLILVGLKEDTVKLRLMADGLKVSCYVQFDLPDDEAAQAVASNGFVYLQAKPVDGRVNPACPTLAACIAALRRRGVDRPIYCGVGVHTPADAAMVRAAGGDGAFIGSAILKLHDDVPAMIREIQAFKAKC
ncbi:MAG: tryptophan synthase subunit alpha [Clostridiales bacterium]|nr:tryptophan synthase subunit alpha [Clostridiales bacterium]